MRHFVFGIALGSAAFLVSGEEVLARSPIADCLDAMAAGDTAAIEDAARRIEHRNDWVAGIPQAEKCLSTARGEPMRYDHTSAAFMPETEYEALLQSRRDAAQASQEKQARQDELAALARLQQQAQEDAVVIRTLDACQELYRRDWVAAMTSQICQPIFMETGLPD